MFHDGYWGRRRNEDSSASRYPAFTDCLGLLETHPVSVVAPSTLILLRHGESEWNVEERFAGWVDVHLTTVGEHEAAEAGRLLAAAGLLPDVVHTSLLHRAVRTADLALEACGRDWIPVRRTWRLNERHYGALQGRSRADAIEEYGAEQVMRWRRSYSTRPPPQEFTDETRQLTDSRYRSLAPGSRPWGESIEDVARRLVPYWIESIVPDLRSGHLTLVTAHGNSMRALMVLIEQRAGAALSSLDVPTGTPLVYRLSRDLRPTGGGPRRLARQDDSRFA